MSVASLARLEPNRERLGAAGAVELVLAGLEQHAKIDSVVTTMATATDRLCQDSESNKAKFLRGGIIEKLLTLLSLHDKSAGVAEETLRALVTISGNKPPAERIRSDDSFKLYVRGIRYHDKSEKVARWGSNLIYCCALVDDATRVKLGEVKACDAIVGVLQKHGSVDAPAAFWASRALVALSLSVPNRMRFVHSDSCLYIVKSLDVRIRFSIIIIIMTTHLLLLVTSLGAQGRRHDIGVTL